MLTTYTYATYATYVAAVLVLWSFARLFSKNTVASSLPPGAGPLLTEEMPP